MNPMNVNRKPAAMKGNRRRVKSDAKARIRSTIAPDTLGATVYRFVLTVLYPNLAIMTGRNSCTDWRGTPRHISMPEISEYTWCTYPILSNSSGAWRFSVHLEGQTSRWLRWKSQLGFCNMQVSFPPRSRIELLLPNRANRRMQKPKNWVCIILRWETDNASSPRVPNEFEKHQMRVVHQMQKQSIALHRRERDVLPILPVDRIWISKACLESTWFDNKLQVERMHFQPFPRTIESSSTLQNFVQPPPSSSPIQSRTS